MQTTPLNPISVGMRGATEISSLGRTTLYQLAKEGKLPLKKVCGRTLIMVADLHRLVSGEAA